MSLTEQDQLILEFTSRAIGRTGAKSLTLGHLDDEPPHRWYAMAQFRGAKVSCENQADPVDAILGLYAMLAAGGECTTCKRMIALDHGEIGLVDGARMQQGVFQTRVASGEPDEYCVRRLELEGWTGCGQG